MARELEDWLDTYLRYTANTESPTIYHKWCGLAVIAGALQRKIYLRWGIAECIFPNIYAILVGPSGRTRKGVALGIAKSILQNIQAVQIAPESSSGREAMILAMKRAQNIFVDPSTNRQVDHCSLTVFSEELSVFLGQGNISYLSNLTDWFDSKDTWSYETVGRGMDTVPGVCLTLMGGTAPDWLQSMIPQEAVGGGFTSRVIFIVEERKKQTVAEPTITEEEIRAEQLLIRDLERINKLAGPISFSQEAKQLYTNWYIEQDKLLSMGKPAIDDPRFAGYCERRATHLRKLMMLSSASRSDSLVIEAADFNRAITILQEVEIKMPKTFGGLGRLRNSDVLEQIKEYIHRVNVTTKRVLLAKFYRDITEQELVVFIKTLESMKVIKIEVTPGADTTYYWNSQT